MFKIESYVTPILLSYVDKYVRDFKPADAQVSLWGGGVALHNLVLKADVLQNEVALPFTLVSGRIHELLIQVPWTKIMSEPIVVTINTIECVLSLHPPAASEESTPSESPRSTVVEAPPGYMQALVRRIVSNISLRVHHLIVKYVQDDIVLSLNVKHLCVESAGADWAPAFADIDQTEPVVRRLMRLDDLTLCLDRADSDGKIRFYQEPLLYRCQLDFRVLTRLVSANTRRASCLTVQLRSSKLAWGVTSEQLTLLLRLLRERQNQVNISPPPPKQNTASSVLPQGSTTSNLAEPVRSGSWSEWAWSWLPTWVDKEGGAEEATMPPTPIPILFSAYLDHVSLVFKVMEAEGSARKRARGVLEVCASHAAARGALCAPTTLRVRAGVRQLRLLSRGKCVCGYQDLNALNDEPTIYLEKRSSEDDKKPWSWPEKLETLECKVEIAQEAYSETPDPAEFLAQPSSIIEEEDTDELWRALSPVVVLRYSHTRSPPDETTNPYESPPLDFQYSDWQEENKLKISLEPMDVYLGMGLLHRLSAIRLIFQELPSIPVPDLPMRTLTVEECEALDANIPQRRTFLVMRGLRLRVLPWDHSLSQKQASPSLMLDVESPEVKLIVSGPLYPHRVCSAACQIPKEEGPLWQGARLHVSVSLAAMEARLSRPADGQSRPVARADLRFVLHLLLHPEMFANKQTVHTSYNMKIREMNTCGSAARLQAAWRVLLSLIEQRPSLVLRNTSLAKDALSDEEAVAIDATMEEASLRGFITRTVNTHIVMVQSARVMALFSPRGGHLKQAWIFSAPDTQTTTAFFRLAVQWCEEQSEDSVDYLGVWTMPVAVCADPLCIEWLAYKPQSNTQSSETAPLSKTSSSSQSQLHHRRVTPPSSSGRGASRAGSGSELVHAARLRSLGSSSEPGEGRRALPPPPVKKPETFLHPDRLLKLQECLQKLLISVDVGTVLVYFTTGSSSAEGCVTMRDAVERLASGVLKQQVLALSMGRLTVSASAVNKHIWDEVRHDGPTFIKKPTTASNHEPMDSFPWKLRLVNVSCYTLETRQFADSGRVPSGVLRSNIKSSPINTRLVLDAVTTAVTLSIVTKHLQIRSWKRSPEQQKSTDRTEMTQEDLRVKYFKSGIDFKPSTLKEFVRGPSRHKRSQSPEGAPKQPTHQDREPKEKTTQGPVVSMGVHLHADTPPFTMRLEHDQVNIVAAAVHCLTHLHMIMSRTPVGPRSCANTSGHDHSSFVRSVSELNEEDSKSDDNLSETYSELIPIFEARAIPEVKLKTFFWFQWVVGRATLVVSTDQSKLAMEIDDIISTVDIQEHYNQLKVKVASASVKHHKRANDDWEAGVLGGRVLEAREPIDSKEEDHFLAVTITQAQISNLPASWKEELHPKLLQQKGAGDSMWEIYATLAPLEAVLQPALIENILSLVREMAPPSFCPLQSTDEPSDSSAWQWPFCYVTAGGLRLLVNTDLLDQDNDDTFLLLIGITSINPHPENPICRQSVTAGLEGTWNPVGGGPEGRQYEVNIKHVAIQSAHFQEIVKQEERREIYNKGTGSENPAVKWSQPPPSPIVTAILHHMDVSCILAPPLFVNGVLTCGPAVELNLASDCALEVSLEQLQLVQQLLSETSDSANPSEDSITRLGFTIPVCPYAALFLNPKRPPEAMARDSNAINIKGEAGPKILEESSNTGKSDRGFTTDSGIDVATSMSKTRLDRPSSKKNQNVAFAEETIDVSEYLEIFVTMGVIDISLYMEDDESPAVIALRPKNHSQSNKATEEDMDDPAKAAKHSEGSSTAELKSAASQITLVERVRNTERKHDLHSQRLMRLPRARLSTGKLALLHVTLHQPNLYYWRKKIRQSLQVSLFNAWIGLGAGETDRSQPLFSTAKGTPDPVTEIPPALVTIKIVLPSGGKINVVYNAARVGGGPSNYNVAKGSATVDVERPVLLGLSVDTLQRLTIIHQLVGEHLLKDHKKDHRRLNEMMDPPKPQLLILRKFMVSHSLESIVIQMSQLGVTGSEGTVGWDSASLQVGAAARPERLVARALVTALLVAVGPPSDQRHVLLPPVMLGMEMECSWEAWRRAEDGVWAREPSVRVAVDLDRVTLDARPQDLAAWRRILQAIETLTVNLADEKDLLPPRDEKDLLPPRDECSENVILINKHRMSGLAMTNVDSAEASDQYYKDDLKSGAFKIVTGGQFPMAYQVTLHGDAMSWRYPHPRTVTRITVFPIPGVDEELKCKLEFYDPLLKTWELHTYVTLPVSEPNEIKLYAEPPGEVFATLWRFRADSDTKPQERNFEFDITKFMPRADPLAPDRDGPPAEARASLVSAEQLSSALRVDSYFSPRSVPRVRAALRCTELQLHVHNSLPALTGDVRSLEGYYVARPLRRSHRVLHVSAADTVACALLRSRAGRVLLLDTKLSCDILECSTGTLEQMVSLTRVQASASVPGDVALSEARVRACSEPVRVALHVPRLSTLRALADDWQPAFQKCNTNGDTLTSSIGNERHKMENRSDSEAEITVSQLEGRVSLWIHNNCSSPLRVGQEGCDEVVPLGPGAWLAYRWPSPKSPFKIRLALVGPSTDCQWSSSIPFSAGETRIRLPGEDAALSVYVHARGEVSGARRTLHLSGRLVLANALRWTLNYKVRAKNPSSKAWRSVCSGELNPEAVGCGVLCGVDCEMVLKIRFTTQDTGWSGDIPLKECPKENVPWLVKVPSEGETPYVSVWCRVVRARADGRVLAAIWPLYVLCSYLPLDTDVLVSTLTEGGSAEQPERPSPLVQTAPGRGAYMHLLAPGTTAARHQLSFQYKDVEHPVTREAIPLHYGVTDISVFDKRAPANNIDEVIEEIREWFERSSRKASSDWPYSTVASHWSGAWSPAHLQPRCDVTVRYDAVRAGGGCSLLISLRPVALLCNAARLALTLRAHDAAPLCRLEPGAAVSAPSALLQKPFFMSMEIGRETFVSGQLQVWGEEPGRYGSPPHGCVALDHPAAFLIHCKQKVALLTLHYEIKEDINVLGVTSTFLLVNSLDTDLLVSGIAVPDTQSNDVDLIPKSYDVVCPAKEGSLNGEALSGFWVLERWRGGDPDELRTYLCLALPSPCESVTEPARPAHAPVPARLAAEPVRRAIALRDHKGRSIPVVIVQQKHEGRWVVTVARDPCPQFVVHNRSSHDLVIAQPDLSGPGRTVAECSGARWQCAVKAGGIVHYSTPEHSARFPPPPNAVPPNTGLIPFITISKLKDHKEPEWSEGVAAAGGEQLVQLPDGGTVKLRVRPYPHSSLLELRDVDENDISASLIRRRLEGSFHLDAKEVEVNKHRSSHIVTIASAHNENYESTIVTSRPDNADVLKTKKSTNFKGNEDTELKTKVTLKLEEHTESASTLEKVVETANLLDIEDIEDSGVEPNVEKKHQSNYSMLTLAAARSFQGSAIGGISEPEWGDNGWSSVERVRCVIAGIAIEMASTPDVSPLLALHIDRAAISVHSDSTGSKAVISIADVQVDNLQYESGNYDFAVVASTRGEPLARDSWPPLWPGVAGDDYATREQEARLLLRLRYDSWTVIGNAYRELTEVEVRLGPLALYIEDGYVGALARLARSARPAPPPAPAPPAAAVAAETRALQHPLRLRSLHLHPLDLTLTLHTAVRMYIALDQSPLCLSAFQQTDMVTCAERLTHALTVHYLSAAILGAGWVVGGLELLGAPGALAARVGGARGGVRGVAAAAAAALLRSLSACAGSLARNLDLLAGDDDHARRAAAARRRHPDTFVQGLAAGITNFAINILGAVGGLAHHPLVGVAVGETEGGAAALRRGLLGALTKPLSATADLVAFAGHGLLRQTGWDPVPQRRSMCALEGAGGGSWRRDCVRWSFRLAEVQALAGFDVLLDDAPLRLLLTHKYLMITNPETERIVEMVDLRFCTLRPHEGPIVELVVTKRQKEKVAESSAVDEEDEYQISSAAMARVARYTGADGGVAPAPSAARVLALRAPARHAPALRAALAAALHAVSDNHLHLL